MEKQISGFSLIELLIALAVIGIGLAITVPTMRDFTNSNRQAEQINKLIGDISFAKNEAVTRGSTVIISQLSATAGDWYGGWQVKAGTTVLKTTPALTVASITLKEASKITSIAFKASGRTSTKTSFNLCDTKTDIDKTDKQLIVNTTGHINLKAKFACPAS